jgi:homeobox protein cut-like
MDLAVTAEPRFSEDSMRGASQDDTMRSQHQEEENKFQKAIAAWRSKSLVWKIQESDGIMLMLRKDIDLTTLVPTLDAAAQDLVSHQRDALLQRKDLAQKTKDFRKLDDQGKLAETKSLLKGMETALNITVPY